MHPKTIEINNYTYELPELLIAKYPLAQRDESKLLVYQNGAITTHIFKKIACFLPTDSLLVFNNTRVVEARILFKKTSGAVIEIFCLEPHNIYSDITSAMLQKGKVMWRCLVGGASKWKRGQILVKVIDAGGVNITLQATITGRVEDYFVIELTWEPPELTFAELLHHAGEIPLPPYLQRVAEEADKESYQTVYAKNNGSVAAPTAGLHFTEAIFSELETKKILKAFVTLHVGAGTFKPVKTEKLQDHVMHREYFEVNIPTLELLLSSLDNSIVAVGTTSLRTIETLYWMGVKITLQPAINVQNLSLDQWYPYDVTLQDLPAKTAFTNLIKWLAGKNIKTIVSTTQILIAPPYKLRVAKGIITNFHQPQSTLLLLIAAIVGDEWKRIYDHALENNFRFLSYGDGCLLWAKP